MLERAIVATAFMQFVLSGGADAESAKVVAGFQPGLTSLPLAIMDREKLVEKRAKGAGIEDLVVEYKVLGNPSALNDGLISGQLQFATTAPASLAILWDKTSGTVRAAAALSEMPSFLVTKDPRIKSLADYGDKDKIALPSPRVSIQAVYLQMAAAAKFGPQQFDKLDKLTIPMRHPDGLIAMLSPQQEVTSHFTSPPFQYEELDRGPGNIRKLLSSYDVLGGASTFVLLAAREDFRSSNPKLYDAFVAALADAMAIIRADRPKAARIYIDYFRSNESVLSVIRMLEDPEIGFQIAPRNIEKVATFLHQIGTIKKKPGSWRDLCHPNLATLQGS